MDAALEFYIESDDDDVHMAILTHGRLPERSLDLISLIGISPSAGPWPFQSSYVH